jgi:hypothetical protein
MLRTLIHERPRPTKRVKVTLEFDVAKDYSEVGLTTVLENQVRSHAAGFAPSISNVIVIVSHSQQVYGERDTGE